MRVLSEPFSLECTHTTAPNSKRKQTFVLCLWLCLMCDFLASAKIKKTTNQKSVNILYENITKTKITKTTNQKSTNILYENI